MLQCYFDDSGTHSDSTVITWGGLLGRAEQWEYLDKQWKALLANPMPGHPRLKQFHLSPCAARKGDFVAYKEAESDRLRFLFRQIIADAGLEAVSYSVPIKAYDELVRGRIRELLGSYPESLCVGACLKYSFEKAAEMGEKAITVTFDQGRMTPALLDWIERGTATYMGDVVPISIGGGSVAELTGLQAADTIAIENWWFAKSVLEGSPTRSAHFKSLVGKTPVVGNIMTRESLKQVMKVAVAEIVI